MPSHVFDTSNFLQQYSQEPVSSLHRIRNRILWEIKDYEQQFDSTCIGSPNHTPTEKYLDNKIKLALLEKLIFVKETDSLFPCPQCGLLCDREELFCRQCGKRFK